MKSNRASYDRAEFDRPEERVDLVIKGELGRPNMAATTCIQEEPDSVLNSNEQLIETRTKWCFAIVVVAALVIVILVLLAERNQKHEGSPPAPQASRFSSYVNADDRIDLRISAETSSCEGHSCVICKTDVIPHLEAKECSEPEPNVKNGSCFLCEKTCLTLQDLLNTLKEDKKHVLCPWPIELDCCILSIMGNLSHYCGEGGRYLCYSESIHVHHHQSVKEPVCQCPHGSRSKHCNKPYTQPAECRCFKSSRKFCGQEQITQCDNVKATWSTCHMTRSDKEYNCLCNKLTGNEDHSVRCPHSNSDPNSTYAFG
ncbi:uncharacterized protein LOC123524622 isoform X2 [Mercenaria mercenaria]|uniref:uncharacterized protein LOC123524622 isoform X2 n=1 Tax=Mercenaria mercenaria TaxID=6596 RepID=UPI00234F9735|nr:uncharacterized protein LOC123524622 isoform X2 [Mercenaria mercenaria]